MNEEYIANAERRRKIADDMAWSSGHAAGRAAERARYAALDVERAEAYFETRKPQTDDTRLAKSLPEPPRPLSAEDEALVRKPTGERLSLDVEARVWATLDAERARYAALVEAAREAVKATTAYVIRDAAIRKALADLRAALAAIEEKP